MLSWRIYMAAARARFCSRENRDPAGAQAHVASRMEGREEREKKGQNMPSGSM